MIRNITNGAIETGLNNSWLMRFIIIKNQSTFSDKFWNILPLNPPPHFDRLSVKGGDKLNRRRYLDR